MDLNLCVCSPSAGRRSIVERLDCIAAHTTRTLINERPDAVGTIDQEHTICEFFRVKIKVVLTHCRCAHHPLCVYDHKNDHVGLRTSLNDPCSPCQSSMDYENTKRLSMHSSDRRIQFNVGHFGTVHLYSTAWSASSQQI